MGHLHAEHGAARRASNVEHRMLTVARRAEQVAALRAADLERLHVAAERGKHAWRHEAPSRARKARAFETSAVLAQHKRASTERFSFFFD